MASPDALEKYLIIAAMAGRDAFAAPLASHQQAMPVAT